MTADWDLNDYFDAFDHPSYQDFRTSLLEDFARLDATAIDTVAALTQWITQLEDISSRYGHLRSFVACLSAADAANEAYSREEAALAQFSARMKMLNDKLMRALLALTEEDFTALLAKPELDGIQFPLTKMREQAAQRMPADQEALASELEIDGMGAWSRAYFATTGNLKFHYNDPDKGPSTAPFAHYNSLLCDADRKRRSAVMAGAASTFAEHQRFFAGAINAISGTRLTLNSRRSIAHFLHPSLQSSRLQQASLEAMMQAIDASLPQIRDMFRYRSHACGISDPGYADLRAPLPIANKPTLDWNAGVRLISSAFHNAYPALAEFFDNMIQQRWIDWSPRSAKRPGGFCTSSTYIHQSRIFMTYRNTLSDVLTLAHEAGHAWHSHLMADARPFAASYPMTLAETASTFAERILTKGILADTSADPTLQLLLLDAEIEHTLAFLLDLPVRFRFESAVYQKRASAELSASELCELMATTQREVFGDSLADDGTDPWFWASKLHFYINEVQFYNYPYTFGFLLSTVMIQHLNQHGNAFLQDYERFMRLSGSASCEDLARDVMQADMADPAFWNSAISSLQQPFTVYKSLLEAR